MAKDHPLRAIRTMADTALEELSPTFGRLYAVDGRPSIAPEKLLRALLLQVLYTVRSERQLMEQLDYNLLFRWFVGLSLDEPVWDVTVFTKNRERLLAGAVAQALFNAVLSQARTHGLLSKEQAADKIKAAVDARTDPDFVIIARSDAIGVTSLDDALDRANAYAEAGADLLFLPYLRLRDTRKAVDALPKPLFNVVIDTPKEELERAGLKVAVYPVQSLFIAYRAVRDMVKELRATGTIANFAQRTPSWEEFNEFIGAKEATQLAEKYRIV